MYGLWVAIRRACRLFSSFCVSTQFVMLSVSIFSSASLALLFMYSTQTAEASSWLDVLSPSSSNEVMLSCCLRRMHRLCLLLVYLHSGFKHVCFLKPQRSKERCCFVVDSFVRLWCWRWQCDLPFLLPGIAPWNFERELDGRQGETH